MSSRFHEWVGLAVVGLLSLAVGAAYLAWSHSHHVRSRDLALAHRYDGTMTVSPSTASPGDEVRLTFALPEDSEDLVVSRWKDGSFDESWLVGADTWRQVGDHGFSTYLDVTGLTPEVTSTRTVLPISLPSGRYQVCTAMNDACAVFTVR